MTPAPPAHPDSAGPTRPDPSLLDSTTPAYYLALGDGRYQPTLHAQGAWNPWEQHMGPVAGLLAHAVERHAPREDMQLARITYDILGVIPASEVEVRCETVRPGRTIELVEATLYAGSKAVVRATAWRLVRQDTAEVAGGFHAGMPHHDEVAARSYEGVWGGGFIGSLHFRSVDGGESGRGRVWISTDLDLVSGEETSDVARLLGLVDTANGVAVRQHPGEWMFPNVDLTVHLFRTPTHGWLGLDTEVTFGETGLGLTSTDLYDEHGPIGRAEQILTVRRLP